jgi:uracil-DNA glycosylase family 4
MSLQRDFVHYLEVLGFENFYDTQPVKTQTRLTPSVNAEWIELKQKAKNCTQCALSKTRTQVVFGQGSYNADIMFVGDAPSEEDDSTGLPFAGPSGELLSRMIHAMGFRREDVFITNVVECRPPESRIPSLQEVQECSPLLLEQIRLVNPKVIVALGTLASQTLIQTQSEIGDLRGEFRALTFTTRATGETIQVMPTFHPAYCLRNPNMKKPVWEDLKKVMSYLS